MYGKMVRNRAKAKEKIIDAWLEFYRQVMYGMEMRRFYDDIIKNPKSVLDNFKSCRVLAAIGIALIVITVAIKREKTNLWSGLTK